MTANDLATAIGISDRRIAHLAANGEDVRNTPAWRDAMDERGIIGRAIAFEAFKAHCARKAGAL